MKGKTLIEIEVDGEVEKTLAILEANGITPEEAARAALALAAKKRAKRPLGKKDKIFLAGVGG